MPPLSLEGLHSVLLFFQPAHLAGHHALAYRAVSASPLFGVLCTHCTVQSHTTKRLPRSLPLPVEHFATMTRKRRDARHGMGERRQWSEPSAVPPLSAARFVANQGKSSQGQRRVMTVLVDEEVHHR